MSNFVQIWDTAGQERFKTLRTPFYRGSDICMLTYAIDDKHSFKNLQMWKNEFLYYADVKENAQFPFIVVGNKVQVQFVYNFLNFMGLIYKLVNTRNLIRVVKSSEGVCSFSIVKSPQS